MTYHKDEKERTSLYNRIKTCLTPQNNTTNETTNEIIEKGCGSVLPEPEGWQVERIIGNSLNDETINSLRKFGEAMHKMKPTAEEACKNLKVMYASTRGNIPTVKEYYVDEDLDEEAERVRQRLGLEN